MRVSTLEAKTDQYGPFWSKLASLMLNPEKGNCDQIGRLDHFGPCGTAPIPTVSLPLLWKAIVQQMAIKVRVWRGRGGKLPAVHPVQAEGQHEHVDESDLNSVWCMPEFGAENALCPDLL